MFANFSNFLFSALFLSDFKDFFGKIRFLEIEESLT